MTQRNRHQQRLRGLTQERRESSKLSFSRPLSAPPWHPRGPSPTQVDKFSADGVPPSEAEELGSSSGDDGEGEGVRACEDADRFVEATASGVTGGSRDYLRTRALRPCTGANLDSHPHCIVRMGSGGGRDTPRGGKSVVMRTRATSIVVSRGYCCLLWRSGQRARERPAGLSGLSLRQLPRDSSAYYCSARPTHGKVADSPNLTASQSDDAAGVADGARQQDDADDWWPGAQLVTDADSDAPVAVATATVSEVKEPAVPRGVLVGVDLTVKSGGGGCGSGGGGERRRDGGGGGSRRAQGSAGRAASHGTGGYSRAFAAGVGGASGAMGLEFAGGVGGSLDAAVAGQRLIVVDAPNGAVLDSSAVFSLCSLAWVGLGY